MSVERIAARAVAARATQIYDRARDDVPRGVAVTREGDSIVLSGRNLLARSRTDPALRGVGR